MIWIIVGIVGGLAIAVFWATAWSEHTRKRFDVFDRGARVLFGISLLVIGIFYLLTDPQQAWWVGAILLLVGIPHLARVVGVRFKALNK